VGVEAAQVGLEHLSEDVLRTGGVTGGFQIIRCEDRMGVEVLRVASRQHLLHLEHRPGSARDDGLGPVLDRLAFLAPVLALRFPAAILVQRERREVERGGVDPGRSNLPG